MRGIQKSLVGSVFALSVALMGCGGGGQGGGFIRNVQLNTSQMNGDTYVSFVATMGTGALMLPTIEIPILDRNDPNHVYGSVALRPVLGGGGGTELVASINVTEASGAQVGDALLPNGTMLPVSLGNNPVFVFPLGGSTNSRVYLALGQGVAVAGVAIGIDQLNTGIGVPINFFPSFNFGNGVQGVAGIYTGVAPGTSGIAFFVDASQALNPAMGPALAGARVRSVQSASIAWTDVMPTDKKAYAKFQKHMYDLNRKRARLTVN
ncbi:MAG: hypothetical protein AB7P04_02120 [Bacteriovoracia bacterium]